MTRVKRWTPAEISIIRDLAAQPGQYASVIGQRYGVSLLSILSVCGRHRIPVARYTPDEQAYADQMLKARNARKDAKRKTEKQQRLRARVTLGTSKTHPIYRNQLPRLPTDTSREALRRMLTQAVRNTAEMQVDWVPSERITAMEAVATHAEENHPGWKAEAAEYVRRYAETHREFISEDATDWAYANGLARPHDPRAFGQVYRDAAKNGFIRKHGYGRSVKRASPTVLWMSCHSNFS